MMNTFVIFTCHGDLIHVKVIQMCIDFEIDCDRYD